MKAKVKAKKAKSAKSVKSIKNAADGEAAKESSKVRKQDKQMLFVSKLQENQKLSVKKTIGKKRKRTREKAAKALGSLSSLLESLPKQDEVIASTVSFKKKQLTSKSHQKVVVKETKQLAAVLAHPEFQADPYSAIQQHLSNTLAIPESQDKGTDGKGKKSDGKGKKKKKKQGKKKELDLMQETFDDIFAADALFHKLKRSFHEKRAFLDCSFGAFCALADKVLTSYQLL
ncbi:hypothetical protein R1sor_004710 [Riccia sorocarpa]|uniref:Ribosome biogenesis protein SLX9 n=1 Tax=Riccia sorocarpa TaxID=122646 RepID=A0ABD3HLE5_9MARC